MEADETLALARRLAGGDPVTFVSSDHGFAPQFLADRRQQAARRPRACCRSRRPPTAGRPSARPSARPRPAGPAAPSRSTSTSSGAIRSTPRRQRRSSRSRRPTSTRPSPRSSRPTRACRTPTTGPTTASPKAGRSSTACSRRRGPLHPERARQHRRHGPSDPDRRRRRVLLPALPVRRRDAGHADRRRRTSSASTATSRTSRTWPTTSTCGRRSSPDGPGIDKGDGHRADDRPRPDPRLHPRHPRAPAEPGPGPDRDPEGRQLDQADLDRRHQRLPRPARPERRSSATTTSTSRSAGRRTWPPCSTRSSRACPVRA